MPLVKIMQGVSEEELIQKAVAPRVTDEMVEENIIAEYYFTGDKALGEGVPTHDSLKLMTFCILVLQNGFTVTGQSACASPENYNMEIGNRIARGDAKNKIWALMGYELRTKLNPPKTTFIERMEIEFKELVEKLDKLLAYIPTPAFRELPEDYQMLMYDQRDGMIVYKQALQKRISKYK